MTTASPTPFATSAFPNGRPSRHIPARTIPRSLSSRALPKRHSPLSEFDQSHGFSAAAPDLQRISIGDSSDDDEIPKPMNFSALTKAILEDRQSNRHRSPQADVPSQRSSHESPVLQDNLSRSRAGTPSRSALRITRNSPEQELEGKRETSPRIVNLSGKKNSSGLRRAVSVSEQNPSRNIEGEYNRENLITPAPVKRERHHTKTGTSSGMSGGGYSSQSRSTGESRRDGTREDDHQGKTFLNDGEGDQDQEEENGRDGLAKENTKPLGENLAGSMRVKRVPMGSGTFLRGAPMRRPTRRIQGEDDQSPAEELNNPLGNSVNTPQIADKERQSQPESDRQKPSGGRVAVQDFVRSSTKEEQRPIPSSQEQHRNQKNAPLQNYDNKGGQHRSSEQDQKQDQYHTTDQKPQVEFRIPSLPPALPSLQDQENEPPPTFKRNKSQINGILGEKEKIEIISNQKDEKMLIDSPAARSPRRQPLAAKSVNTPQRPAPPPPKMSVLATATADGGASTVKSKNKPKHMTVNGKAYPLRGKLGRGGSSVVYRVMAENDRMFALKRVNLEDANEDTVRGYKGEIELLKKLEGVDRVVRLLDWEVNDQKQTLCVLMEIGESDLNRILSTYLHPEDAKLDLAFTRHYWREMLECVAAVHEHDIVHSDLKPANFLLVQGRLKLIDFGIANAIDVENTVNVHRETNVGTPNYMSPESLQDTNANKSANGNGAVTKLMKLGKPSDVWSLGCILYQMTYGKPPFAHIANQWNRIMAIINPAVVISYPAVGVGGVTVPSSLRRLLRSCLNRDPALRPTLAQLLSERESFLNPDGVIERWEADGAVPITEQHLEQILQNIVRRCRDPNKGIPSDAEMRAYPKGFMDQLRSLQRA